MFNGQHPLKPQVVQDLVSKISQANPRVIGIDLDVSLTNFRQPEHVPVVWARDIKPPAEDGKQTDAPVVPVGLSGLAESDPQPLSGLCVFPRDGDGAVRRYRREFPITGAVADALRQVRMDSFPWAVVKEYCPIAKHKSKNDSKPTDKELILNYVGDRYSFDVLNAGDLLKLPARRGWSHNPLFHERIVLIGGVFREARDEYRTPVGKMAGVQLLAHAIQADLLGGGVRELAIYVTVAIDVLAGMLLVYLNWRFRGVGGFVIALGVIFALCVLASYLAFWGLAYWLNFPLVMFGILLHLQIHNLRERGKHAGAGHLAR